MIITIVGDLLLLVLFSKGRADPGATIATESCYYSSPFFKGELEGVNKVNYYNLFNNML